MADSRSVSKAVWATKAGRTAYAPPLWETELRVFDILAEQTGLCRALIHHDARLIEDLSFDSLDVVELILTLEERFGVGIPDDAARAPFVGGSITAGNLAEIVRQQWSKPRVNRRRWFETRVPAKALKAAFSQSANELGEESPLAGPPYERLDVNEQGFARYRRRTDGMRCVLLPAATVEIGSDAPEALPDQQPAHRAMLSSFLIDAEPVSTTAFAGFLNRVGVTTDIVFEWCGVTDDDRRSRHFQLDKIEGRWLARRGTERQPMVLVSWYGAAAYSLWANGRDWRRYSAEACLPSEAQWEYAARGASFREFPWGDRAATVQHAHAGLHTARAQYGDVLPIADVTARLGVSPFGVLHMAGNVWNWCADWYSPEFYHWPQASGNDPLNTRPTGTRSERGGSWVGPASLARSSYRRGRAPDSRCRSLGFRCIGLPPG